MAAERDTIWSTLFIKTVYINNLVQIAGNAFKTGSFFKMLKCFFFIYENADGKLRGGWWEIMRMMIEIVRTMTRNCEDDDKKL